MRQASSRELDQRRRKRRHTLSVMAPRNSKTIAAIATNPLNCGSKPVAKAIKAISNKRREHVGQFAATWPAAQSRSSAPSAYPLIAKN